MSQNRKPKPGDLIEIFRGRYQHWAIYVGDGNVIHLVRNPGSSSSGSSSGTSGKDGNATVKKETLQQVAGNDKYCINNQLDDLYKPRPIEDILQEAERFVGKEFPYDLLSSNCEHYATLLRYGKPQSQQVEKAKKNLYDNAKNILIVALMRAGGVFGIIVLATLIKIKEVVDEEDDL